MKCPYRISVHKKEYKEDNSTITREQTIFEECYDELCPFYLSESDECSRANQEGGNL